MRIACQLLLPGQPAHKANTKLVVSYWCNLVTGWFQLPFGSWTFSLPGLALWGPTLALCGGPLLPSQPGMRLALFYLPQVGSSLGTVCCYLFSYSLSLWASVWQARGQEFMFGIHSKVCKVNGWAKNTQIMLTGSVRLAGKLSGWMQGKHTACWPMGNWHSPAAWALPGWLW